MSLSLSLYIYIYIHAYIYIYIHTHIGIFFPTLGLRILACIRFLEDNMYLLWLNT